MGMGVSIFLILFQLSKEVCVCRIQQDSVKYKCKNKNNIDWDTKHGKYDNLRYKMYSQII